MRKIVNYISGAITLRKWIKDGGFYVTPHHAKRRADVCAICPMNVSNGALTWFIARIIRKIIGIKSSLNMAVKTEKKLGRCASCSCELNLKIWTPIKYIRLQEKDFVKFDNKCWLIKESI